MVPQSLQKVLASRACLAGILRPFASLSSAGLSVRTFNVAISKIPSSLALHLSETTPCVPRKCFSTLQTSEASQHMYELLQLRHPGISSSISQAPFWSLAFMAASANESAISFHGSLFVAPHMGHTNTSKNCAIHTMPVIPELVYQPSVRRAPLHPHGCRGCILTVKTNFHPHRII